MAKAIEFTPTPKTPQQKLHESVEDSIPALGESLQLLRELHEHGVLELLVKLTRGGEGLSAGLLGALGGQSGVRITRNLIEVVRLLDSIDPGEIKQLSHAVSVGVSEGARSVAQGRTLGLPELLGLMRDRDVQLALGGIFGVLKGTGRALREARGETSETENQHEFGRGSGSANMGTSRK